MNRSNHRLGLAMAAILVSACSATPAAPQPGDATPTAAEGSATPGADAGTPAARVAVGTSAAPVQEPDAPLPPSGELDGIPVGFTEAGHPYRGSPDAPVVVEEFSDYHCPFCMRFATQVQPTLLEEYAADGRVRFVFREYPIVALHPGAAKASEAAQCVAEQGAAAYWKLHDALYAQQGAATSAIDVDAYLADLAEDQGADRAAFEACVEGDGKLSWIQAEVDAAQALGFNGTPSFRVGVADGDTYELIGAQPLETYRSWFDALLAGDPPPVEPTAAPPKLPYWASAEGLAPDPDRPGTTMAGDPFEGEPDAPLTVVEFSDYQCPPCREYALEAHPQVREAVIEAGRARWVFKSRPLPEHAQSAVAAAAAECALAQGQFSAMHDALFEHVDRWAVGAPEGPLAAIAGEAGLDEDDFRACLAGRQAMEAVLADVLHGADLAPTTPTFVVIQGGKGSVLRGSKPADEMIKVLEGWILDEPQ